MKKNLIYLSVIMLAALLFACDENEVMPSYEKVGTATHTMAGISISNDEPVPTEAVTLTLMYVNPSSDPLENVSLRVKVGAADFVELQAWDVSQEVTDEEYTRTVDYQVPDSPGTALVFDLVITSQREFAQVKRVQATIED